MQHQLLSTAAVLTVEGEVDLSSAPELQSATDEALRAGRSVLVMDLSGVTFFGSAGLNVLIRALRVLPPNGLRVVISAPVQRAIEVTGLDSQIPLRTTLEQALEVSSEPLH
ncbi:STAS domain-containing protein [Nocardia sp. XZ_19_385]|uniref:STAS domain-containing protein n=1 Tax=Nocardia sp. XZ_19_385 TaxID=2769488 RepID=UPI002814B06D|nr:STAS domain-containing protein [Nocardia sp. XZ_19_385]